MIDSLFDTNPQKIFSVASIPTAEFPISKIKYLKINILQFEFDLKVFRLENLLIILMNFVGDFRIKIISFAQQYFNHYDTSCSKARRTCVRL